MLPGPDGALDDTTRPDGNTKSGGEDAEVVKASTGDDLRAEISGLASQVVMHGKMLEGIQRRLLAVQCHTPRTVPGAPSSSSKECSSTRGSNATHSLAAEVHALTECIAAGEAAIRSLAPRLLAAAASNDSNDRRL